MCVNDLVVHGAEPLFFLDYFATGRLEPAVAETVISGIAAGCRDAHCALIGGETAEMPGMYANGTYDLAGFAVGVAERDRCLDGGNVTSGDLIIGLASSGLHSNGFSLVRRIVSDLGLDYRAPAPFDQGTALGEALLTPTRIYVKACLAAARSGLIKAFAHITGGGLVDNLPRVLPPDASAEIDAHSWTLPPVFSWLASNSDTSTMVHTFNCGIGMAVVVSPDNVSAVEGMLADLGETVWQIGHVTDHCKGASRILVSGADSAWSG